MKKTVQPIRQLIHIEQMKNELLKRSERDYFLFVFGINSGLRISDILPLKVRDVKNKDFVWVKEQKTGKDRKVEILPSLKAEIAKYIEGKTQDEYLFKTLRMKKPISGVHAYRILNAAADVVGLDEIGTHTMRKTFGYHFYQRNRDLALVQKVLGHSSPSITMRYIGLDEDEIKTGWENFGGL